MSSLLRKPVLTEPALTARHQAPHQPSRNLSPAPAGGKACSSFHQQTRRLLLMHQVCASLLADSITQVGPTVVMCPTQPTLVGPVSLPVLVGRLAGAAGCASAPLAASAFRFFCQCGRTACCCCLAASIAALSAALHQVAQVVPNNEHATTLLAASNARPLPTTPTAACPPPLTSC